MQSLKLVVLFACAAMLISAHRPAPTRGKVNWLTLELAEEKLTQEKRPVLIDLYTDWCGWCKVMDKKTYGNKLVAEYLGQKFYPVKINAEGNKTITWKGKKYLFNTNYRTSDFALFLTKGKLSYPTTVILPPDGSEPQAIPGYLEPKDFELIVKYFGEGTYQKIPFDQYQKGFKSTW